MTDQSTSKVLLPANPWAKDGPLRLMRWDTVFEMVSSYADLKNVEKNSKSTQSQEKVCSHVSTQTTHTDHTDSSAQLPNENTSDDGALPNKDSCASQTDCLPHRQMLDKAVNTCPAKVVETSSVAVNANMDQTGIVTPIPRVSNEHDVGASRKISVQDYMQRKLTVESETAEEPSELTRQRIIFGVKWKYMKLHLTNLQNFIVNTAREKPSSCMSLMSDYIDHVSDTVKRMDNEDIKQLIENDRKTIREFEKRPSWKFTTELEVSKEPVSDNKRRLLNHANKIGNCDQEAQQSQRSHQISTGHSRQIKHHSSQNMPPLAASTQWRKEYLIKQGPQTNVWSSNHNPVHTNHCNQDQTSSSPRDVESRPKILGDVRKVTCRRHSASPPRYPTKRYIPVTDERRKTFNVRRSELRQRVRPQRRQPGKINHNPRDPRTAPCDPRTAPHDPQTAANTLGLNYR